MTRRRWLLAAAVGAFVVVAVTLAVLAADGEDGGLAGLTAGETAPTVTLDSVRTPGRQVDVPGDGPAIVNFFASWCVPCKEELPELQRVWEEQGDEVAVVGVDVADNRRKAVELLDRTGAEFPAGYDPDKEVAGRYAVNGMPTTVFVDGHGRMVGRVQGKVSRATLLEWVERLRRQAGAS